MKGKMATAIMNGIISSGYCKSENIFVSDKNEQALVVLKEKNNVNTTKDNMEVVKNCNIILFAVKPFVLRDVLTEIKPYITENHLVLSIAAGISTTSIEEIVGKIPVIRIMPNTPALVNEGMSAVCAGKFADESHISIAEAIFSSVGKVIKSEEKLVSKHQ